MTAIWRNDGKQWSLLAPSGYPNEAALHTLVEEAPHILPLAGAPQLTVVGREVQLGSGRADLIALEPSGRVAVIEVKLASNGEARRAVVAQVLTYAAYLRGLTPAAFESILKAHLQARGYEDLVQAALSADQQASVSAAGFSAGLQESLANGWFRLVLVLDSAPAELVRLVGYLESVTQGLLIDLISVAAYEVNGSQVIVPQRVEDDAKPLETPSGGNSEDGSAFVEGAEDFKQAILQSPEAARPLLQKLYEWAIKLEQQQLAKLYTYHGKHGIVTLLPRLPVANVGIVTVYNNANPLRLYRKVLEKYAPGLLPDIEELVKPSPLGQGTAVGNATDTLLQAISKAYTEAAQGILHQ